MSFVHVWSIVCIILACELCMALKLPSSSILRKFVALPAPNSKPQAKVLSNLRVLQFNILADGLSGLRSDLGGFSRVDQEILMWQNRKWKILDELLQFKPDVITLQECDHYDDFFLPELAKKGYDGVFMPKPTSACLQVSNRSDGCALFVRSDQLKFVSVETLIYAPPPFDRSTEASSTSGSSLGSDQQSSLDTTKKSDTKRHLKTRNQVALIAVCEARNENPEISLESVPIIIATTHLKAAKTASGERERLWQATQLLDAVSTISSRLHLGRAGTRQEPFFPALVGGSSPSSCGPVITKESLLQGFGSSSSICSSDDSSCNGDMQFRSIPVVITGDLNTSPDKKSEPFGYESLVYPFIKHHALQFRSVMNDDLPLAPQFTARSGLDASAAPCMGPATEVEPQLPAAHARTNMSPLPLLPERGTLWTSWKTRWRAGQEHVVKHCIDYILYATAFPPAMTGLAADNEYHTVVMDHRTNSGIGARVSVRATAVLDTPGDETVGPEMLPSAAYPSDHISLVADLQVLLE